MKWALNLKYFCTIPTFGSSALESTEPVFALRVELAVLLLEHQHCHADCFENSEFILVLAYMADVFGALNQQMQGDGVNIIEAEEHLKVFEKKSNYGND